MKYKDLDSKQRANYWSLMMLLEIIRKEIGEDNPILKHLLHSISILETNLGIELYSDGGELWLIQN